jgi:3-phenylpropionate/cinnamic acid dioxygenase small subunit
MIDDVQAIKNVLYSYAELLDGGDVDGFARLFEDAAFRTAGFEGAEFRGAEAVGQLIRAVVAFYEGIPATKHVLTNVMVEVDPSGTSATTRSYFTVFQARPELPLQPILAGRYHDRFERVADRWRYADHLIHLDLIGDVSHHSPMPQTD